MTDRYLDQLEDKFEQLLLRCENLQRENVQLNSQLDQTQRVNGDRYDELIQRCATLELNNKELAVQAKKAINNEQLALQDKLKVAQVNQQTRNQVEKMIARLKSLEQNA